MRTRLTVALALLAPLAPLTLASLAARAQLIDVSAERRPAARTFFGADLLVAQPQDEFASYVKVGAGFGFHLVQQLDREGVLGLRVAGDFLIYGNETETVPISPTIPRVTVDVQTSNNIVTLGIGPQVMMPVGGFRPYLAGTVGFSYFFTESSVRGSDNSVEFASSKNYDDITFAWTGAAGVYIPVRRGRQPISIDIGARYHGNGRARYLREGSIQDDGAGGVYITPIESNTNLITYQLGVTVGMSSATRR
jgi:hypothetical protein